MTSHRWLLLLMTFLVIVWSVAFISVIVAMAQP
jgi:hypothetical protein